jgi:NAD-dependent dihydropyrimidine dehydrogenase PreA subunit
VTESAFDAHQPALGRYQGDDGLTDTTNCYRKAQLTSLKIGGLEVGISGLEDIMDKGLAVMDAPDDDVREILLKELRARNYVPGNAQEEYMRSLWAEFKKARVQRKEQLEMSYKGIPREEIPWFPRVDESKCSGCSSCVEFCTQGVFSFDGKSHVIKPYNCMVGNSSCRTFCPEKAISFPTTAELKEILSRLKQQSDLRG